jgi:actin-related protein
LWAEKPYAPVSSRHRYCSPPHSSRHVANMHCVPCRLCETMFEKYSAPAFFLSKDAVLAAYACGKTGGLVIVIGASGAVVTPVQDGWVESKGMSRTLAGGRMIDAHIRCNVLNQVRDQSSKSAVLYP